MVIGQSLKGKGYNFQAFYEHYHPSLLLSRTDFHLMFMLLLSKHSVLCRDKFNIATKTDKIMSVFIGDIDKFKRVNDTYGHNAGDDVLAFTSHLIESFCGEKDGAYRWGGEEFVMVLRDTDLEGAVKKAEEIRVKLMESDISADGNTLRCTLSFGCALFDPSKSIEDNISAADEKLYTAKETGRNKVCWE